MIGRPAVGRYFRKPPRGGISVEETLLLLSKGGVLADVRTLLEYEMGHAPGARLVDPDQVVQDAWSAVHGDDPLAEPDGVMVFICDTGHRSSEAATEARAQGHKAEFVDSGIFAWRQAGQFLLPGPPRTRR